VNLRYYARLHAMPSVQVVGEDLADLPDEIRRAEARLAEAVYHEATRQPGHTAFMEARQAADLLLAERIAGIKDAQAAGELTIRQARPGNQARDEQEASW
jgi:hypothetical protein